MYRLEGGRQCFISMFGFESFRDIFFFVSCMPCKQKVGKTQNLNIFGKLVCVYVCFNNFNAGEQNFLLTNIFHKLVNKYSFLLQISLLCFWS